MGLRCFSWRLCFGDRPGGQSWPGSTLRQRDGRSEMYATRRLGIHAERLRGRGVARLPARCHVRAYLGDRGVEGSRGFGAYRNVVWSLSNEYDFLIDVKPVAKWDRFFHLIAENDPARHLKSPAPEEWPSPACLHGERR